MNFNIYNSIILAGVIQGIIFGFLVLFSKKYRSKSVFFLALLIIVYSLSNLQYYFQDIGLYSYEELFSNYTMPWADLTPALLYFYVILYLYPEKQLKIKDYFVFLPALLTFFFGLAYKVLVRVDVKIEALSNFRAFSRNYVAYYADLIAALLYIIVIIILFKQIQKYKKQHNNFQIDYIKLQLNWLNKTLFLLLFLVVIWVSLVLFELFAEEISYYPIWLGVAFLIYWLGHIGIYKFGIDTQRQQIRLKSKEKKPEIKDVKSKHLIIERLKKYLIDEKRFLDPDLTMEKTAEALELSRGHLSKIINTELGVSFKDYINSLRVEEAKSYLLDDDFSNYTLVAIGLEAGFNSKSTFNASFKKITGETPSQYKQRHAN